MLSTSIIVIHTINCSVVCTSQLKKSVRKRKAWTDCLDSHVKILAGFNRLPLLCYISLTKSHHARSDSGLVYATSSLTDLSSDSEREGISKREIFRSQSANIRCDFTSLKLLREPQKFVGNKCTQWQDNSRAPTCWILQSVSSWHDSWSWTNIHPNIFVE